MVGMVWLLVRLNVPWPVAMVAIGLAMVTYIVAARVVAETGMFFLTALILPGAALTTLMGPAAIGPAAMLSLVLWQIICFGDMRAAVAPTTISGVELARRSDVRLPRLAGVMGLMLFAAVAVGLLAALYISYRDGMPQGDQWAMGRPASALRSVGTEVGKLKLSAELTASESMSPIERVMNISPSRGSLPALAIGLGLTLTFAALRYRVPWWPLHPVMFVLWGGYEVLCFSASFLLGWAIRGAVVRFAGQQGLYKARAIAMGLICGEMLAGLGWIIVGWVYYAVTGLPPKEYGIFPF
jgi:hypothetical protein